MQYRPAAFNRTDRQVISTVSEEALGAQAFRGMSQLSAQSLTWVANLAVFIPFGVSRPFLVREVWWYNGSTGGNNIDVALYDTAGNRLATLGSTAQGAAVSAVTSTTWNDYTLAPGDYYMAYACDGTVNDTGGWAPAANLAAGFGVGQMASAFALPNPATIVPLTNALLPWFGLNGYTLIA